MRAVWVIQEVYSLLIIDHLDLTALSLQKAESLILRNAPFSKELLGKSWKWLLEPIEVILWV